MHFNTYQWDLYLKSGGADIVKRFNSLRNGDYSHFGNFISELVAAFNPDSDIVSTYEDWVCQVCDVLKNNSIDATPEDLYTFAFNNLLEGKLPEKIKVGEFRDFSYNLPFFSSILYPINPERFLPYYFWGCFNVLQMIAEEFEIELPSIPAKTQYEKRCRYYDELMAVLIEFRKKYDLSPDEMCAFLYDYAPKCIGGKDWVHTELPEPRNVYVFGIGPYYAENDPERVWINQGSPDMQIGDIGVLYHWAPDKCYTSIWRAVSQGYYDPLYDHDRCVCYGFPVLIPRVTYKDLTQDEVFSQTALVKTQMLKMDGAAMLPSEYKHLLEMASAKGNLPNNVPQLMVYEPSVTGEYELERDVESQLLEPLLKKLGWMPDDWCRQMSIRIGRGTSKYPDYVIKPVFTKNNERGEIILEAKLTIPNKKQLEEDRGQAHSYAKLLGAKAYVLVAKQGIWICEQSDNFKVILGYTWEELNDNDIFMHVYNKIGKKGKECKILLC